MTVDNAKKQNILIIHNYYQIPGGEDTVVANEKKMLEKHGHKVILYSRNNAELKQMSKLQKVFLPITTVFNPRTYRDIKKLIRDEKIEIVHVHNTLTGIDEKGYDAATGKMLVCVNPQWFRPTDVDNLWGDPTKAKTVLGWNPQKTSYEELVEIMAKNDRELAKREKAMKAVM